MTTSHPTSSCDGATGVSAQRDANVTRSATQSSAKLRSRIVDAAWLTSDDIAAWRSILHDALPKGNAFFSPAFTQAAQSAFGRVEVCLIEDNNGLAAVFPYQFNSNFAAAMRAAVRVGEEMSDRFGIVARSDFHIQPRELLKLAHLNYLYFTHMHQRQIAHGFTGEARQSGLKILLPQGGDAYWADLETSNPKFAADTRRRERHAIDALGPMRFVFDEADRERWLPVLLRQKREQYLRTNQGDWLAAPGRTQLIERLAHQHDPDCSSTLSMLFFGETWAAMHFGLRSARTLHYWLQVYNPALSQYAPGRLLLRQVILSAERNGIEAIDRGTGENKAKGDFPAERQFYYGGVWHRQGLRAYAYRAYQSARWRLSSRAQPATRTTAPAAAE